MMEHHEYQVMYELENDYWWFVARRNLITEIVRRETEKRKGGRIFDVGCGTGANLEAISRYGRSFGVDLAREAIQLCHRRGLKDLAISRVENLAYLSESFDIITALDVLEHIDNDLAALDELFRICKPGGMLLITVPAYGFLWSEHDEALHHRRRYAAHELRNKLTIAGFEVERCSYFITSLFFPILVIRIMQGIFKNSTHPKTSHVQLPKLLSKMIILLLFFEQWLIRYINLPFGVSIVCTSRKPETVRVSSFDKERVIALSDYSRIAYQDSGMRSQSEGIKKSTSGS
jgi:2-polyprenyl-3-methyl-5-hydroxy-6-metoxy-1,4-benzoquinol methylase